MSAAAAATRLSRATDSGDISDNKAASDGPVVPCSSLSTATFLTLHLSIPVCCRRASTVCVQAYVRRWPPHPSQHTMTLHPVLALTPLLALLFVPCQCSQVGSIFHNFTASQEAECNSTCTLLGPECQHFIFWKNSTCFLLNCSNGSSCLKISEEQLRAERGVDLVVQDHNRPAAAPDFNRPTESNNAGSSSSSSSSSSSAGPTKNLEVSAGNNASLTSNSSSTKGAHSPSPLAGSSAAGQTSDAAEPSTRNDSSSASLPPTQPATPLPPHQGSAILPQVPTVGLKRPDASDQPSTHTGQTPTLVATSTTAQIAIEPPSAPATVKSEPSPTTMTTTTTATTIVTAAARTTASTAVPPSTTASASSTKTTFTSPSAMTTSASSTERITPPSSKKTTATTSTLASTAAAPVISVTSPAAENKPSMTPTTLELSSSSPAPPIPETLAPPPIATPGPVPVSTNRPGNTNVAAVTRVAIVDVAGEALTRQLVDTSSLLAVLLFGLLFFVVAVGMFVKQAYESYQRKDYTQVDYLINGMYSDSGV